MPDWVTHILVAWMVCTILSLKYKQINPAYTVVCMAGALIPDIYKIVIPLGLAGIHAETFLMSFHLPAGSLILAGIFTLFFKEKKKLVLLLLVLGVATHYALDLLIINFNGGIYLLFPFSWSYWQFDIIPDDDYIITIASILAALGVYLILFFVNNRKVKSKCTSG